MEPLKANQQHISDRQALIKSLALKVLEIASEKSVDLDRYCWAIVHEYTHGFMPVEYDIREIDETLYLSVQKAVRSKEFTYIKNNTNETSD